MTFSPSNYSGMNYARLNEGEEEEEAQGGMDWSAFIGAAGAITTKAITARSQSKALKSQQAHEASMAKQQETLYALQTESSVAQTAANNALAAVQGLATTKTLFIVGGVVLTLGIVAATIAAVRRGGQA